MQADIEALRTFFAIARAGGITAAADGLRRSVPALSRRLSRLEAQLGAELLDRTTRPALITPVGRELLRRVAQPLEELESALAALREQAGGGRRELTIASIPTAAYHLLPSAVLAFEKEFPRLRVRVRDLAAGEVCDAVARSTADLGISFAEALPAGLLFRPLVKDPFVLALPPQHPFARRRSIAWSDLAEERLIGIGHASDNRVILDRGLTAGGVRPRWHHEVQHLSTALGFVQHGLGLAPLPRMALLSTGTAGLVTVLLVRPRIQRVIGAVTARANHDTTAGAFVEQLVVIARGLRR
jgi:DNA-binding transcriptional LysR family regulator